MDEAAVLCKADLTVLMMDGSVLEVAIDIDETVKGLKKRVAELSGIGEMMLVLYPETWEDEKAPSNTLSLEEAGIGDGSTLMAVVLSGVPHQGSFVQIHDKPIYGIEQHMETKPSAWNCCFNSDESSSCCCTCGGRWHLVREVCVCFIFVTFEMVTCLFYSRVRKTGILAANPILSLATTSNGSRLPNQAAPTAKRQTGARPGSASSAFALNRNPKLQRKNVKTWLEVTKGGLLRCALQHRTSLLLRLRRRLMISPKTCSTPSLTPSPTPSPTMNRNRYFSVGRLGNQPLAINHQGTGGCLPRTGHR
jgi:hypothetical protein